MLFNFDSKTVFFEAIVSPRRIKWGQKDLYLMSNFLLL